MTTGEWIALAAVALTLFGAILGHAVRDGVHHAKIAAIEKRLDQLDGNGKGAEQRGTMIATVAQHEAEIRRLRERLHDHANDISRLLARTERKERGG